jgi:transcriptional regulator with XRE-family HTH domain
MPSDFDPQDEIRRLLAAVRTAIRLSGVSYRQIERELQLSTGYLTRILAGQVQLRVTHVLSICLVIGVPPASFFAALYPPAPPASEAETRLLKGLAQLHPKPALVRDPETLLNELRDFLEDLRGQLRERK